MIYLYNSVFHYFLTVTCPGLHNSYCYINLNASTWIVEFITSRTRVKENEFSKTIYQLKSVSFYHINVCQLEQYDLIQNGCRYMPENTHKNKFDVCHQYRRYFFAIFFLNIPQYSISGKCSYQIIYCLWVQMNFICVIISVTSKKQAR